MKTNEWLINQAEAQMHASRFVYEGEKIEEVDRAEVGRLFGMIRWGGFEARIRTGSADWYAGPEYAYPVVPWVFEVEIRASHFEAEEWVRLDRERDVVLYGKLTRFYTYRGLSESVWVPYSPPGADECTLGFWVLFRIGQSWGRYPIAYHYREGMDEQDWRRSIEDMSPLVALPSLCKRMIVRAQQTSFVPERAVQEEWRRFVTRALGSVPSVLGTAEIAEEVLCAELRRNYEVYSAHWEKAVVLHPDKALGGPMRTMLRTEKETMFPPYAGVAARRRRIEL